MSLNRPKKIEGYPICEDTLMKTKTVPLKYPPEVRERAVRLVEELRAQHLSDWAAILAIVPKIGCNPETLRTWYCKH